MSDPDHESARVTARSRTRSVARSAPVRSAGESGPGRSRALTAASRSPATASVTSAVANDTSVPVWKSRRVRASRHWATELTAVKTSSPVTGSRTSSVSFRPTRSRASSGTRCGTPELRLSGERRMTGLRRRRFRT